MRLLVNNIEQEQRGGNTNIVLFGRSPDAPSERQRVVVHGFEPYFYAPAGEANARLDELLSMDCISAIDDEIEQTVRGHDVVRVEVPQPQDTRQARELFDDSWESDVPFTNRFRVDSEVFAYVEVPESGRVHWSNISPVEGGSGPVRGGGSGVETALQNLEPRVVTLDIEVDDRGDDFPEHGDERILSVVAHDAYDDETVGFYDGNGRNIHDLFPNGAPERVDRLDVRGSEAEMLDAFVDWFVDKDPDLITGWNVDGFDAPFLIERLDTLRGVNKDRLSPMGWAGVTSRGEARIKGRTIYDLLTVYKRNNRTELRSYKLDDVAEAELGREKIQFNGSYYDLYENDPEKFVNYNAVDVELVVEINDAADVISFRDRLRRQVGVDFEDSYDPKDFADMMCRRALKDMDMVGPRRPDYGEAESSDYEGALVLDPYEGVTTNVVGIDLASLYPYTMAMLNASPDTKVEPQSLAEKSIEGNERNDAIAEGGTHFTLERDGLFRYIIDNALDLKADFKAKLQSGELSKQERAQAERSYMAAKVIVNSLYGVTGWERFFLYDKDVAEAVTLTGQAVIRKTRDYIEEQGYDVVYGDTDSCYIKFPDEWSRDECLDMARELTGDLNDEVYPQFAQEFGLDPEDNMWEIEVEAYMKTYFQAGKKKRYAYLATWKDGHEIEDPEPSISGFASKRSDSSALTERTEKRIFDAILHGASEDVDSIIFDAAKEIHQDDPDWELIGIPGGMNNKITDNYEQGKQDGYYAVSCKNGDCYPQSAHPRGAYNSNKILGTDYGKGDKPMRVYIEEQHFDALGRADDVLCYESAADIDPIAEEVTVDVARMLDTTLIRPLENICNAIGVDIYAAVKGQTQTGLGAFS